MSGSAFIVVAVIALVTGLWIRFGLAELKRKAELQRLASLEHLAKLRRKAELERQSEDHHQAELERQAELKRLAEDHHQARPPPQLPPIPTLSPFSVSLSLSTHSGQPTPPRSPTPQAPSHHVNAAVAFPTPGPTDENRNALLFGVQGSTTAREDLNVNENVNANATLRRRPVHVVDNTIHEREHSAPLLGAHSSTMARGPVNSTTTLPKRPVAFDDSNNNGSEHYQGAAVPTHSRLRLEPSVTVSPCSSSSGVSRSDVYEWRKVVALGLDEQRRRHGQDQPMSSVVDGRPLPSSSVVPTLPPVVPPLAVLDEPNPDTLPQTPTRVKTDSSVPSNARSVVFTPSPQPPLSTSTTTTGTNAGADGANASIATQDREFDVPASALSAAQATTASLHGDSSSTSQLLVTPPNASSVSPQHPPFSPLSSMLTSTQSNQPISFKSQSPPQTPYTPPYLLTSSAQHPHYSSPYKIVALASSPIIPVSTTTTTTASIAPTHSDPSKTSPPASAVLSLSQSYPISLNQEQGMEIVSDPTCSFQSSSFSDPFDLVAPESPGPFGSPGLQGSTSLQSPFIPLSPPLPVLPIPPGAGGNVTGGDQRQRKPLSLLGSASSVMTTTARQSSSLNPPLTSSARSMFYPSTHDGSTTSRQPSPTSLPARLPPPAVPDGMLLSFPSEINAQQQHRFASPGIMSPVLSELDFVSEFGGSNDGDIGSESSWSSDSCRDAHT